MMYIVLQPRDKMMEVFPQLTDFIIKAAQWTLGKQTVADISLSLFAPTVQTWLVVDSDTGLIHGFVTSEIVRHLSGARHLSVLVCGGRDKFLEKAVDPMFDTLEHFAREHSCDGLEFIGRPAWWKFIEKRGYQQPQRQYFKKLGDV